MISWIRRRRQRRRNVAITIAIHGQLANETLAAFGCRPVELDLRPALRRARR